MSNIDKNNKDNKEKKIYTPLSFWFNPSPKLALPIFWMRDPVTGVLSQYFIPDSLTSKNEQKKS